MSGRAALGAAAVLIGLVVTPAAADLPRKSPRASLVQVLRGGKQALLLDRGSGEYQVVKVGDAVQGFRVTEIEDDQIVLASPAAPERFFVLPLVEAPPAPATGPAAGANVSSAPPTAAPPTAAPPVSAPALPAAPSTPSEGDAIDEPDDGVVDPYSAPLDPAGPAPADSMGLDPIDPYDTSARSPGEVPSVIAPPDSRAPASPAAPSKPVAPSTTAPSNPAPSTTAPSKPSTPSTPAAPARPAAPLPADPDPDLDPGFDSNPGSDLDSNPDSEFDPGLDPDVDSLSGPGANIDSAAPPSAPPPARSPDEKRTLSRRQLDEALADFGALARQMQIEPARGGGVKIVELERGSFVAKLGIERGDVVRRVAGHSIDSVDEAAAAYAVVATAREVVVELERRGKPLRIRYRLTR